MTIGEAIYQVDALKPNSFEREEKVRWLSEMDGLIHREIILTHEHDADQEEFLGYDGDADPDTALLAEYPYDILYRWYLESQIDLYNAELDKYNNSVSLYNNAMVAYRDAYNREHMPITKRGYFKI